MRCGDLAQSALCVARDRGVIIRDGRYYEKIMYEEYVSVYNLSPKLIGFLIVRFPNM